MTKKQNTTDISNIKLQGDQMVADIFKSGGDVGSTAAAALTILTNMDRAPKEDVIKSCVVLAGLAGTFLMGYKGTRQEVSKQFQIPSERKEDLMNTIKELEAVKENRELEKKVAEFIAELSGPAAKSTAITDSAAKEPTKKDLEAELKAKVAEVRKIKDDLARKKNKVRITREDRLI